MIDEDCDISFVIQTQRFCCRITVLSLEDIKNAKLLGEIERRRTAGLQFSPKNTFLATWEPLLGVYHSHCHYCHHRDHHICLFRTLLTRQSNCQFVNGIGKYRDILKKIENIRYFRFFRYFWYIYIYIYISSICTYIANIIWNLLPNNSTCMCVCIAY